MIIAHTYQPDIKEDREIYLSAIESDLISLPEFNGLEEAIRNDPKFEDLETGEAYKLILGRAYIDPGVRDPSDPGAPYWHIKFVLRLAWDRVLESFEEPKPSF